MKAITLDGTSLLTSRLGLGTARLHHLSTRSARVRLLRSAFDLGYRHIDTSPLYGHGLAEVAVGIAATEAISVTVTTKVGLYPPVGARCSTADVWLRKLAGKVYPALNRWQVDSSVKRARASVETSLRRLRRSAIDFVLLHDPVPSQWPNEAIQALFTDLIQSGKARACGVAGNNILPLIERGLPSLTVIQTLDHASDSPAAELRARGKAPQFTYGAISQPADALGAVRAALARNDRGCVLVSSRRPERLAALAALAE